MDIVAVNPADDEEKVVEEVEANEGLIAEPEKMETENLPNVNSEETEAKNEEKSPVKNSSPKKSPKKESPKNGSTMKESPKKKNAKKEEEDEDEAGEDEDEEEHLGLYDKPVIIEGRRQRTSVSRLQSNDLLGTSSPGRSHAYKGGKGIELSQIEWVSAQLLKHKPAELKPMHQLLFGTPGKMTTLKRDIRTFNGFDFEENSDSYTKRVAYAHKMTIAELQLVRSILGLPSAKASTKDGIIAVLVPFLMKPSDLHKKLPQSKRKSKGASTKRKSAASDKAPKAKKARKETSKETVDSDSSESKPNSDDEEDEEEAKSESGNSEKSDESEGAQSRKKPTSDEEIKSAIKKMLNELDLTEVTMKQMIMSVMQKFPNESLEARKNWIKTTIKQFLEETA